MQSQIVEITSWYQGTKHLDGYSWEFNHYTEGYDKTRKLPELKFPEQKSFSKGYWRAERAFLITESDKLSFIASPLLNDREGTLCTSCSEGHYIALPGAANDLSCNKCASLVTRLHQASRIIGYKAKLKRNRLGCAKCGDIIESKSGHDFRYCKCSAIFVDGGLNYCRCGGNALTDIIDLAEYEKESEVRNCSRPQPHDGPCNGWPCEPMRKFLEAKDGSITA